VSSWREKKEWQKDTIEWRLQGIKFIWFFAIVWNGISAPAVFVGIPQLLKKGQQWPVLVICIFPLVGLFLIWFALYKTLQKIKYGSCSVTPDSMPIALGSKVVFRLALPQKLQGIDSLNVNVTNVRRTVSGSGKNRSVNHSVLWKSVKHLPLNEARIKSGVLEAEIEMTIPFDCVEHDETNSRNSVFWQLSISAETPGIDFQADFRLPVSKTEQSDPAVMGSEEDEEEILAGEPRIKGIQMQEIPDGLRLFIKPFRFISSAFTTFILAVLFGGVGVGMVINGIWFGLIFAAVGFFVLIFSVHYLLIQTEIVFFEDQGQVKSTWLGMGVVKEFDLDIIKDVRPKVATQTNSDFSGDKCQYTIELIPEEGESLSLCDLTRDYSQALWIAAKLKEYINGRSA
jgi:hypothetical protein